LLFPASEEFLRLVQDDIGSRNGHGSLLPSCCSAAKISPAATHPLPTATITRQIFIPLPAVVSEGAPAGPDLALGGNHTCARTTCRGVRCWGNNRYGQLGNGTFINSSLPADVSRLTNGVTAVAAGWAHTCALMSDGGVKCWGINSKGQLGDSTETDRSAPADVLRLAGTAGSVAAGYDYTCTLMRAGNLRCWGNNEFGQLGDGTNAVRHTPVDVQGFGEKALAPSAGFYTTCAMTGGGGIRCWGNNLYGQLGNGAAANSNVPAEVVGGEGGS
jgi:alpha-tubulin suppressor-like RCC1 family protein